MEPELLLLDEPVAGMNLEETEDMARFILDIQRELGIPMILVEHDMGLVMDIADRVLVLDFGERIARDARRGPDEPGRDRRLPRGATVLIRAVGRTGARTAPVLARILGSGQVSPEVA